MKRLILFTVLGLLAAVLALQAAPGQNQSQRERGVDVDKRVTQLQQRLNLDSDQTGKIRSILQTENDRIRELRSKNQNTAKDRSATAKEMQQIRQDSRKQIESVLTKEQVEKLRQQRGDRAGKARKRP